uniref:(northern house mosquito) hypothetical protein n=1 Tax=Culex pipiens TaxID=7175 RepID=A0A8D8BSA7_CULPI
MTDLSVLSVLEEVDDLRQANAYVDDQNGGGHKQRLQRDDRQEHQQHLDPAQQEHHRKHHVLHYPDPAEGSGSHQFTPRFGSIFRWLQTANQSRHHDQHRNCRHRQE